MRVWGAASGQLLAQRVTGHLPADAINAIAISPHGDWAACGSDDGVVRIWSLRDDRRSVDWLNRSSEPVTSLAFAPDGRRLAIGSVSGRLSLVEINRDGRMGRAIH